ncbi:uncharacterized protein HD556DRAFT_457410 [Suillus plorans]|uniref:Uncharacterized protein n=1 Tax=Suillus plorans TaxID=116603 RepID=A0A9P7AQB8_9AGAM|nr:uncharacterized protein HD556DRAFT_457410 [Suillus plorans]KAG1793958.1 hypothetical protein HD556DRAFT_457410 [Suillus plorans]
MTQYTPHVFSSNGSDSSNVTQYMPNTSVYMGQFPWPQPACIPNSGVYYPYGMPANGAHSVPPPYVPVAPSPGAGVGVAHHVSQAAQNSYQPPVLANVSYATHVGPYPPLTAAAPSQDLSAPPLYHQPFPSISFSGGTNPYAAPIPHQGYFHQHHGPGLATGFVSSSLPQAPSFSVSQKCIAEDLDRHIKQSKIVPGGMKNDPLFTPVLDELGQPKGTFVCSRDGMILNPESYLRHIRTKKHLGFKLEKFKCHHCSKTYTRRDAYKRHFVNGKCEQSTAVDASSEYSTSENSTSSASAAPVTPTMAFTCSYPYPMLATSMSQNMQIAPPATYITQSCGTPTVVDPVLCLSQSSRTSMIAEPEEEEDDDDDDDDAEFWEGNEIKDI